MAKQCKLCNKKLGLFANYSDGTNPVCFECANNRHCEECDIQVVIADQSTYMGRTLCPACFTKLSQFTPVNDSCFPVDKQTRKPLRKIYETGR